MDMNVDWSSMAPAGMDLSHIGKEEEKAKFIVPASLEECNPAKVKENILSTTVSSIRGLCPSRVDTGLTSSVDNLVDATLSTLEVDKVDSLVTLQMCRDLTRWLVQWTPEEKLAALRTEDFVDTKEYHQRKRERRSEARKLMGKPKFIVNDDACFRAMQLVFKQLLSGTKPNIKAIFRSEFGDNYKLVLDSHYLIRDGVSLTDKMLDRLKHDALVKVILSSKLSVGGVREYVRFKKGTIREAIAGISRIYYTVQEFNNILAMQAEHEQRILRLEAGLSTPKVDRVDNSLSLDKEKARVMREQGMTFAQIATELGRSRQAIHKWFK